MHVGIRAFDVVPATTPTYREHKQTNKTLEPNNKIPGRKKNLRCQAGGLGPILKA
jgi:hypothetical protein